MDDKTKKNFVNRLSDDKKNFIRQNSNLVRGKQN